MRKSKMNSENFYFSNASKTDLGKKLSRLYLIGNISKEEYTDKIRNIADKMKADDAYIESLNIESLKFNLDACIDLFENVDANDIAGRTRNYDLLNKIIAYYKRFDIAPIPAINCQNLGYVEAGFFIASSLISKEVGFFIASYSLRSKKEGFPIASSLISKEEVLKPYTACKKPDSWYDNIPHWVGYAVFAIGLVVIGWLMYIQLGNVHPIRYI